MGLTSSRLAVNNSVRTEENKLPTQATFMPQPSKQAPQSIFLTNINLFPSELPIPFQVILAKHVPPFPQEQLHF